MSELMVRFGSNRKVFIMKILLINGSPKGKNSNSLILANSFIEGLREEAEKNGEVSVEELDVVSLKIDSCKG